MAETVVTPDVEESQDEAAEAPAEATPQGEDVATIKRRLAGKDQALSRAAKERDEYRSEVERLTRRVAEFEEANTTELERIQKRAEKAEAALAKAQEEARRNALARRSPVYADFLDTIEGLDLASEDAAEAFNAFVKDRFQKAEVADEDTEPESRIDPNRPRREQQPEPRTRKRTTAELEEELKKLPADALLGR